MVDLDEFIRRYEAVRANEDSKDKINEVSDTPVYDFHI